MGKASPRQRPDLRKREVTCGNTSRLVPRGHARDLRVCIRCASAVPTGMGPVIIYLRGC
jgi:hypothetical protein